MGSADVIDVLADLFITRGTPGFIRSDNGGEFTAKAVKGWITGVRASTAYIEPGTLRWLSSGFATGTLASSARGRAAPWRASTASCGTQLLDGEVFNSLAEAKVLIEQWRVHYNTVRPHSSLGYHPPAPHVLLTGRPMLPGTPNPTGSAPPRTAVH